MKRRLAVVGAWLLLAAAPAWTAVRPDFTGLWRIADADLTVKPGDDPAVLTDDTRRQLAEFARRIDGRKFGPAQFCMPHGMPWIMVSRARDYLIDVHQTRDRITMLFEGMDVHRLIHLEQQRVPEGYTSGTNGYSIGRWQGDSLVIETTALRAMAYGDVSYRRSDQMRVTERWRLIRHPVHGEALEVRISAVDPVLYRAPATGYQLFVRASAGSVLNAYGCNETAYEDRMAEMLQQSIAEEGK